MKKKEFLFTLFVNATKTLLSIGNDASAIFSSTFAI